MYRLESLARHALALLLPDTVTTNGLMLMKVPGYSRERVVMTETCV